jgi:glycerol-3-phosphate acyltransferase PlsX
MNSLIRISLDAMGGDHGLSVIVPAALEAVKKHDDIILTLVGDEQQIKQHLKDCNSSSNEKIQIHHATQVVMMDEPPAQALRGKKDSSMRVAINLIKEGHVDAAVSAGNTGALMATARFVLRMISGVDRPAICSSIPSVNGGHTHLLDLGANVDCKAANLYQFAVMGSILAEAIDNNPSPKIALLNIGQEAIKGNEQVKASNELLEKAKNLNYIGYVEGDGIFHDDVDVVICDGFVGNTALKTMEGAARMLTAELKAEYTRTLLSKVAALLSLSILNRFRKKFDPRHYNGASFLGLQGIVIKSHGGMDSIGFANAISIARSEVINKIPKTISKQLETIL